MGSSNVVPKSEKKVVIVGGSFAGLSVLMNLISKVNILLIDKMDHFDYICTAPRALVKQDFIKDLTIPYEQIRGAYDNQFDFMHAQLEQVNTDQTIQVKDQKTQESKTIAFDYLVLCCGASYPQPIRTPQFKVMQERRSGIAEIQQNIAQAESILVVGGGATGVELVGELVHFFPNKRVGLVGRSKTLLPYLQQPAQQAALRMFNERKVELFLGMNYDEEFRQSHNYDYVVFTSGLVYESSFMKQNFADSIAPSGQIFVNDFTQVINYNPTTSSLTTPKAYNRIYCLGDLNYSRIQEEKGVPTAKLSADICAENILRSLSGQEPNQVLPRTFPTIASITFGPQNGILVFNSYVKTGAFVANMKAGFLNDMMNAFNGNKAAQRKLASGGKEMKKSINCCNNCCCCCPCAKAPAKDKRE